MTRKLNEFEARQFALFLLAGAPAQETATYFLPADAEPQDVQAAANSWLAQKEVRQNLEEMTGGPWQEMTPEKRMQVALDKMYAEMAFFMWTHNYGELEGAMKAKADTCRAALEAKLAGTAGKGNALEQFYEELLNQRRIAGAATLPGLSAGVLNKKVN